MTREERFRQKLIERVAYETPFARWWALRGKDPQLAGKLGIHEDILVEAVKLLRSGYLPDEDSLRFSHIKIQLPREIADEFLVVCETLSQSKVSLCRSLWHTMMQTTREPTPRAERRWDQSNSRKVHGYVFRDKVVTTRFKDSQSRLSVLVPVTQALCHAVAKRAAAYGVSRNRYAVLWVADLVDGLLADVLFPPVELEQCFLDTREYVLPVVERAPA